MIVDPTSILTGYGLAGLVITVEAAVIIYLNKKVDSVQNRYNDIQEQRIVDARETRDKITEPLEKQAVATEKTYDLLLNFTNQRRN